MESRRVAAVFLAAVLIIAGSATAQLVYPGDFLVADPSATSGTVFLVSKGTVTTFTGMIGVTNIATDGYGNYAYIAGTTLYHGGSFGQYSSLYSGAPLVTPSDMVFSIPRSPTDQWGLHVLDYNAAAIFSVDDKGVLTTVHQGQPLVKPVAFTVDGNGTFWIVDDGANALFRMAPGGAFTTFLSSTLDIPTDIQMDRFGNFLITDKGTSTAVFKVNEFGNVTTVYNGSLFREPTGIWIGRDQNYYVTDETAGYVYKVTPAGSATTFAANPAFSSLQSLLQVPIMDSTYAVLDRTSNTLYQVWPGGYLTTIHSQSPWTGSSPDNLIRNHDGDYVVVADNSIYEVSPNGQINTVYQGAPLSDLTDIALGLNGDYFVSSSGGAVYRVSPTTGSSFAVTTFYTGGLLSSAEAIEVGPYGNVYVADPNRSAIWRIASTGSSLHTYYKGSPLSNPNGLVWGDHDWLYVSDSNRSAVFRIGKNMNIEEFHAGNPFVSPTGIHTDVDGSFMVVDDGARKLFRVNHNKTVTTLIDTTWKFNGVRGISTARYDWHQGDLIVSTSSQDCEIYRFNHLGIPHPIAYPENYFDADTHATCIVPDRNNHDFVATLSGTTSGLARITPNGMISLHWGLPLTTPTSVAIDENGNYVVTQSGSTDALYRFDTQGNLTTVYVGSPLSNPQCVTIDNDTGDYVVLDFGSSSLYRINYSGTLNTIATGIFGGTCVVHNQWDRNFYLSSSTGNLYRVTPAGGITTLYSGGVLDEANSLYVTPDHKLYVTDAGPGPNGIYQFDFNGNLVETLHRTASTDFLPTSCTYAYGRPLSGCGTAQVGTDYNVSVNLPTEANLAYTLAASMLSRPVIMFQGRGLALFPDILTGLSMSMPPIFDRFGTGFLNNHGQATATIHLPNMGPLVGLRFYVSGFTSQPGYGYHSIHTVFNTIGLTVR